MQGSAWCLVTKHLCQRLLGLAPKQCLPDIYVSVSWDSHTNNACSIFSTPRLKNATNGSQPPETLSWDIMGLAKSHLKTGTTNIDTGQNVGHRPRKHILAQMLPISEITSYLTQSYLKVYVSVRFHGAQRLQLEHKHGCTTSFWIHASVFFPGLQFVGGVVDP